MMENENMKIIEEVAETGMVEEVVKATSSKDVGFGMLIGGTITLAGIAIGKGVIWCIKKLQAKKKAKTITRVIGNNDDDGDTIVEIEDIEDI